MSLGTCKTSFSCPLQKKQHPSLTVMEFCSWYDEYWPSLFTGRYIWISCGFRSTAIHVEFRILFSFRVVFCCCCRCCFLIDTRSFLSAWSLELMSLCDRDTPSQLRCRYKSGVKQMSSWLAAHSQLDERNFLSRISMHTIARVIQYYTLERFSWINVEL